MLEIKVQYISKHTSIPIYTVALESYHENIKSLVSNKKNAKIDIFTWNLELKRILITKY